MSQKLKKAVNPVTNLFKKILYDKVPKDPIDKSIGNIQSTDDKKSSQSTGNMKSGPILNTTEEDLIERQYSLFLLQQQHQFITKLKLKYSRMYAANEKLPLHLKDGRKEDFELFNKQARIPTMTRSKLGWDYELNRNK